MFSLVEASTPLDAEQGLPAAPDVSAVEPRQRVRWPHSIFWAELILPIPRPDTAPAENITTTEECEDTLPSPPRVFYSRHVRTNCPVCQKDISSSYIDRHLRNSIESSKYNISLLFSLDLMANVLLVEPTS